jgi:ABC-2 type transport system ATP-binding protein
MLALEIKNLSKTYISSKNSKVALSDFSMEVEKGSIFGLLGPNGAGKSTVINILAGLVTKSSGSVKIMGVDIDEDPQLAKYKIGVVPQEITLDTFFPLRQALEFYAGYFGIKPEKRKTDEILNALGLADKANATSRQLSGGMKRRFLVAKAMVHSPDVLILDEPTAGVDIELRDQLWDYVLKLNKLGTTIILTTHYLEEAEKLCDKIAFINSGNLIRCDSKQNLLSELSMKELKLKISSDITEIPTLLEKYSPVLQSSRDIKITYNKEEVKLTDIISDIAKSNLEIADLNIHDGKLEDLFRNLYKFSFAK